MGSGGLTGNGYLLVGGLVLVGIGFLLISSFANRWVALSVRAAEPYREKLFEYYRNTASQLGVILIGIGVSLFIFFFQQNYHERQRYASEVRQLLAKISVRVGRAAAAANWLMEFDGLIRYGGDSYVVETGPALAQQVRDIFLVERDVNLNEFRTFTISEDIAASSLAGDINPLIWFAIADDESEASYAAGQLAADYADLHAALGGLAPEAAVADPERAKAVAKAVVEAFLDMDLLRDRGRRLIAHGCWFIGTGPDFLKLKPIDALEARYSTHEAWIEQAKQNLSRFGVGGQTCFEMLKYHPEGVPK